MESKQQPSLQNNLLIKHIYIHVYSSYVSDRKTRVWHNVRNRTSPVCSDNTTCCPTEHDLCGVCAWTQWRPHKPKEIKKKCTSNIRMLNWSWVRIFCFYPAHMYRGRRLDPHSRNAGAETSDSEQETSGCSSRYQKKMGKNIQYLEFLLNRVNFKTNRTFESCVVTEKWHQTAIKTRFKEFIQHLFHASLAVTLRTLCLTPPSARPRCGNVRLFFITI